MEQIHYKIKKKQSEDEWKKLTEALNTNNFNIYRLK